MLVRDHGHLKATDGNEDKNLEKELLPAWQPLNNRSKMYPCSQRKTPGDQTFTRQLLFTGDVRASI